MGLTWIVPGRRAVITEQRASYRDVLDAWIEQLDTHRDVLVGWYGALAPGVDLDAGLERAVTTIRRWVERFAEGTGATSSAVAPGERHRLDELGFWARLWDGPLRVLALEGEEAEEEADDDETGPIVTELELGGTVRVVLDRAQRIALNYDAVFVPGDVVELPLFRALWIAGIAAFADASFNPEGSCFLGTAVRDGAGNVPGRVWLHDNMVAMRFQLLFNFARGGFSSKVSGFSETDQTRKTNPVRVEGQDIHARGICYGGSLANPGRGSYHLLADNRWGNFNVPTGGTLDDYVDDTRLTTGWACNPCALNLLTYMIVRTESWGGGSVNGKARNPGDMTWRGEVVEYDHFHHTFRGVGGAGALQYVATRRGLAAEQATSEAVRDLALRRMFGRPLPPAAIVPDADADAEPEAPEDAPGDSTPPSAEAAAADVPIDRVVRGETAEDDDEEHEPEGDHEYHEPPPALDVGAVLPANEEVEVSHTQVMAYLEGSPFAVVGLNGHEYSWVVVAPHASLLDEPRQTIDGQPDRPPQVGPIAAYDPLTGIPYVPDGEPASAFVFEATGSFHPCKLLEPGIAGNDRELNFTVFKVRPFRFHEIDQIWLRRDVTAGRNPRERELQIGESASYSAAGRAHVRGKHLLGISRASWAEVRQHHGEHRTFAPIFLHVTSDRQRARELRQMGYASRAVPGPTLAEAGADTRFATLAEARRTMDGHRTRLRSERRHFVQIRGRAGSWTTADREHLRARTIARGRSDTEATWMGKLDRAIERLEHDLRARHDGRISGLVARIRTLRNALDGRYAPDEGHSRETQLVEARQAFHDAIEEERERSIMAGAIRRGRSRRSRTAREEELRDKVAELADARRHAPSDAAGWRRLTETVYATKWIEHVDEQIDLLGTGGA